MYKFGLKRLFVYITTLSIVFACCYWFVHLTGVPDFEYVGKVVQSPYNTLLNPKTPDQQPANIAQGVTVLLICAPIFFGLIFILVGIHFLWDRFKKDIWWPVFTNWAEKTQGKQE